MYKQSVYEYICLLCVDIIITSIYSAKEVTIHAYDTLHYNTNIGWRYMLSQVAE